MELKGDVKKYVYGLEVFFFTLLRSSYDYRIWFKFKVGSVTKKCNMPSKVEVVANNDSVLIKLIK